jgi:uncharacterized coiled-coil protein SlyX
MFTSHFAGSGEILCTFSVCQSNWFTFWTDAINLKFKRQIDLPAREIERRFSEATDLDKNQVHARYIHLAPTQPGEKHVIITVDEPRFENIELLKILGIEEGEVMVDVKPKTVVAIKTEVKPAHPEAGSQEVEQEKPKLATKENDAKLSGVFEEMFLAPVWAWVKGQIAALTEKIQNLIDKYAGDVEAQNTKIAEQTKQIETLQDNLNKKEVVQVKATADLETLLKNFTPLEQKVKNLEDKVSKAGQTLKG